MSCCLLAGSGQALTSRSYVGPMQFFVDPNTVCTWYRVHLRTYYLGRANVYSLYSVLVHYLVVNLPHQSTTTRLQIGPCTTPATAGRTLRLEQCDGGPFLWKSKKLVYTSFSTRKSSKRNLSYKLLEFYIIFKL